MAIVMKVIVMKVIVLVIVMVIVIVRPVRLLRFWVSEGLTQGDS